MAKQIIVSKEGFLKLQNELEYLKTVKRKEVAQAIQKAREYGDLSENSEYDEARDAQAKCYARISEVEYLIEHAKIFDESQIKEDVVNIGSKIKVYDETFEEEVEYHMVGSNEVDALNNLITDQSPIGRAMIGAKAGDTVTYTAPCGEVTLKILAVSRDKR